MPNRRDPHAKPRLRLGLRHAMRGLAIAARMLSLNPGLSIALATGSHQDILAAVLRRDAEVAGLPDLPPDPPLPRASAATQEVVAIVAADGPWQGRDALAPDALAIAPLPFRSRGSSTRKVVDRAFPPRRACPRTAADRPDPRRVDEAAAGIETGFMWRHGGQRTDRVRGQQIQPEEFMKMW